MFYQFPNSLLNSAQSVSYNLLRQKHNEHVEHFNIQYTKAVI